MRLMERGIVTTVKLMRRMAEAAAVPPKGVWRFWGRTVRGWGCGGQGEGRGRECVCLTIGGHGYCSAGIVPLP
jgi:hypothetical protein